MATRSIHSPLNYSQSFTLAALSTNGLASSVMYSGGGYALTGSGPNDGTVHPVTVTSKSGGYDDHSGKTITIVGTDANDVALTGTMAGPTPGATVESTDRFKTVSSVTISATTGTDLFDIGWAVKATFPWVPIDHLQLPTLISVAGVFVSGTATMGAEYTTDDITTNSPAPGVYTLFSSKTGSFEQARTGITTGVRLTITTHSSGVIRQRVLQGSRR